MTSLRFPRTLWFETETGAESIAQAALPTRRESIVVLGEAGMGKSELLGWLGTQPEHRYCTARQLRNVRPGPATLLGDATTLVVDALDELSVRDEGDAVDVVLQKLGEAGHPRFILSCRVADWRNATGLEAIREQYPDADLLILHLDPLQPAEIRQSLAAAFARDESRADDVIDHFSRVGLNDLLGNPQTLDMVARVAAAGDLPDTKTEIFERAVDLLRQEHRDTKADRQPDAIRGLDAAGAACAGLILTGADALVKDAAKPEPDEIPLVEAAALPGGACLPAVLGSRLFRSAGAPNRFTYLHRRVGEFVGARWLAHQADTALKRRRLLALFQATGAVPASLRGLHAWLARDPDLAAAVIAADPMGVIEYGDADALPDAQADQLLDALVGLAARDPFFIKWQSYALKSVVQPPRLARIRALINDPAAEFALRLLLIQAVRGAPIAEALRPDLRVLLLDPAGTFAHRRAALEALAALDGEDWSAIVAELYAAGGDDNIRLALEAITEIGLDPFTDKMIIDLAVAQAIIEHRTVGLFSGLDRLVPDERLSGLLDTLAAAAQGLGNRHERHGNDELTDLGYTLLARRLALGGVDPAQLWTWLQPFDAHVGYRQEGREAVHALIAADDALRRATQRLVVLNAADDKNVWQRAHRLLDRSSGFSFTEEDIVALLDTLDPRGLSDEPWQDLLRFVHHSLTEGLAARAAAKRLVAHRPDMLAWIDRLAEPGVPAWQVERERKQRQREAKQAAEWAAHRADLTKHIDAMRRGQFGAVMNPATAYLGLYSDMDSKAAPKVRLVTWLGEELAAAAIQGFEAFLQSDNPPTAAEVAESHAQSRAWTAVKIIVAALAERVQSGQGFTGVSDDRLTTGFYELQHHRIDLHVDLKTLKPDIDAEMAQRGLLSTAIRGWIEPQLAAGRAHVDQLYALMRHEHRDLGATALAVEWLERFPDLPAEAETEMVDRLIIAGRVDTLRRLLATRGEQALPPERQRTWDAVAFLVDFDAARDRLARLAAASPEWFWTLRRRIGGERGRAVAIPLTVEQLAWLATSFRSAFPNADRPSGVSSGDTNPWDATEFMVAIMRRLADLISDDAVAALTRLRDAPGDGYTTYLRALVAEQAQKRAEDNYSPPSLADVRAIVDAAPPRTVADLQATLLELLANIQKRVDGDPADPWVGFYRDAGPPQDEERCRDHLLTMLGPHPEGIELLPEGHLADDNRADIIAVRDRMRLPIEIKGQWHRDLWHAADTQLDRLYGSDYAAERRGIYLVLWFGHAVEARHRPRSRGRGQRRPATAAALQTALTEASPAARDKRVAIVVIDLKRPQT